MTIEVSAMNDESAENKLDKFLSGLDLKKNENLKLTSLEFDDGEGEDIDMSDSSTESLEGKKTRPALRLPKNAAVEWDEEDEDVDWDSLDEEDKTESPRKPAPVEGEEWDWEDEDGEWEEDDDENDDDDGEGDEVDDIEAILAGIE
jgi:hypothetical protein